MRRVVFLMAISLLLVGCFGVGNNYLGSSNTNKVVEKIQDSRKLSFANTTVEFVKAVMVKVNEGKQFKFYDKSTLYMVPVGNDSSNSCVKIESGGKSPFSNSWNYAYVGVIYNGTGYKYAFIGFDNSYYGFLFMALEDIEKNGVEKLHMNDMANYIDVDLRGYYNSSTNEKHALTKEEIELYSEVLNNYSIDKVVYLSAKAGCKY